MGSDEHSVIPQLPLVTLAHCVQCERRLVTRAANIAADEADVLIQKLALEPLGEHVRRVVPGTDFLYRDLFLVDLLLYPQILLFNVPCVSNAFAVDDAKCGCGICMHGGVNFLAVVPQQAGEAFCLRRSLHKRIEFGLAGAERDDWL